MEEETYLETVIISPKDQLAMLLGIMQQNKWTLPTSITSEQRKPLITSPFDPWVFSLSWGGSPLLISFKNEGGYSLAKAEVDAVFNQLAKRLDVRLMATIKAARSMPADETVSMNIIENARDYAAEYWTLRENKPFALSSDEMQQMQRRLELVEESSEDVVFVVAPISAPRRTIMFPDVEYRGGGGGGEIESPEEIAKRIKVERKRS